MKNDRPSACAHGRRDFLCKAAAIPFITVAAVLVACEKQEGQPTSPGTTLQLDISTIPELADVGSLVQWSDPGLNSGQPVFIYRKSTTAFNVFVSQCSHEQESLFVPDAASNIIVCQRHAAQFLKTDGTVQKQPNNGGTARNLTSYATSYDAGKGILSITP